MAGFKFSINVEPQDIPRLDDAHKRDCADMLGAAADSTLKYTLIMSGAVLALFAAYSLFGFTWMLRMGYMLPQVSGFVPLTAAVIFLFEFISGTMKGWALALQTFFHVVMIFASLTSVPTLVVVPFAIYGAILHFKLITLLPWYKIISVQPGYPEFTPLPERKHISSEKKPEDTQKPEEEKESDVKEPAAEKQADAEKSVPAESKPEEKQPAAAEDKPNEDQSASSEDRSDENKPAAAEKHETAGKPSGGNGKKKHKRRKGKK